MYIEQFASYFFHVVRSRLYWYSANLATACALFEKHSFRGSERLLSFCVPYGTWILAEI